MSVPTSPTAARNDTDPLLDWRQRTVALQFRFFLGLILPLVLINASSNLWLGRWPLAALHLALTAVVVTVGLTRPHDYRLRGLVLVGASLISCISAIVTLGNFGIGLGLVFVTTILGVLLLGPRAGLVVVAIGMAGVTAVMGSFGLGLLPYPHEPASYATAWPVIINNVLMTGGIAMMLAVVTGSLVTTLQQSVAATRAALAELGRVNASLEAAVAARTEELVRSRALLQGILDHSPVAVYAKDLAGRYLLTNRYMHQVHALSAMEGTQDSELFGDGDVEAWRAHERAVLASGQPVAAEVPTPHHDGPHLYYEIKFPLRDAGGAITAIGGIAIDITARKEAELALAAQLRYAEALARCSRVLLTPCATEAAFRLALGEALTVVREAVGGDHLTMARYAGPETDEAQLAHTFRTLAASDGPGLPPQRMPTPAELADMPEELNVWLRGGGLFNGPVAGRFPAHPVYQRYSDDNGIQSVLIQSLSVAGRWWGHLKLTDHQRAHSWDAGAVQLLRTAAEMIVTFTEGWEAARALQEREAMLREVGQMAQVGGWSLDRATRSLRWSDQVFAIHELPAGAPPSPEESLAYYAPEARPILQAAILDCAQRGLPWDLELPLITAKGRRIWVRAQGQPVREGEAIVGVRGTVQVITARKEAELALAASEAKYRALFALLPTGVILVDTAGRMVEVNPAAERLLGLSAEAPTARRVDDPGWDMIRPDGAPLPPEELPAARAAREGRIIADVELGVRRPDGGRVWLSVSAAPLARAPHGVAVAYTDITARKEAELALAAELRYAEALASCSRTLLAAGADAPAWEPVVQRAMATLREAVGCTRLTLYLYPSFEELPAEGAVVAAPQDTLAPLHQPLPMNRRDIPPEAMATLRDGGLITGAPQDLFPAGSRTLRRLEAAGVRSLLIIGFQVGGQLRGSICASERGAARVWDEPTARLIRTGREMIAAFLTQWETASALRVREAQLRAVGDNLPNGFIYQYRYDREHRPSFTYLSSGITAALGVTPEAGLASMEAIRNCIAPEELERLAAAELRSLATMGDFAEVVRHVLADGSERWLYLCSRPRPGEDGSVIWDGVALDITGQQRAAEELARARDAAEAATRAKSAFLASMSHEIRTPLNAVIGVAALLRDTELTAEQRAMVDTIHTGGEALFSVISDILDFSRIESGRVELEIAPFDLHACLSAAVDLIAPAARRKGLAVGLTWAPAVPREVVGDMGRLRQVLLNLLGNAVKFTAAGAVGIHADAAPSEHTALVSITVRDTGIGMTQEQLARIFEPFVQAERSTARRYGGTGLGLAISRQLVELMGGSIEVASDPGAGSTFTIRVPLQLAPPAERQAADWGVTPTRPLRVLVAEDNPLNQEVLRLMLGRLGHAVTIVPDGLAAVEAAAGGGYDVVLMDVQMPELDGVEAARRIRALGPAGGQPRIIALTASALPGDRERLLGAGMDAYLSKPVQLAQLEGALGQGAGAAEAGGPPDGAPLVEWATLANVLQSLGPRRFATYMGVISRNLPAQIDALTAAVASRDLGLIRREAHKLRGGSLQLGALALADLCDLMEHASEPGELPALVVQVRACYLRTHALIRERYPEA